MQLTHVDQLNRTALATVARESRGQWLAVAVVATVLLAASTAYGVQDAVRLGVGARSLVLLAVLAVLARILRRAVPQFRRAGPDGWVLAVCGSSLVIRLHPTGPAAARGGGSALVLDAADVASVGLCAESRPQARLRDSSLRPALDEYLDVHLRSPLPLPIRVAIHRAVLAHGVDVIVLLDGQPTLVGIQLRGGPHLFVPEGVTIVTDLGRRFPVVATVATEFPAWRHLAATDQLAFAEAMIDRGHMGDAREVLGVARAEAVTLARRRRSAALCVQCGYDLRGAAGPCPECGTAR